MAGWIHLLETGKLDEEATKRAIAKLRGNIDEEVRTIEVDRPLRVAGCAVPYCRPVEVNARDFDGDGEPEILTTVYTGGAHCCTITQLLTWDGTAYRQRFHDPWDVVRFAQGPCGL